MTLPAPYYRDEDNGIVLYCGDCLELLPQLDGIDVIVTDPPFGRAFASGWDGPHQGKQIAGDCDTDIRDAMLQLWRDRPALVFGSWRRPVAAAKQAIVWDKGPASGMGNLAIPWKESWELIFVCGSGFKGFRGEGIIHGHTIVTWATRGRLHPNQKPVGLLVALIRKCVGVVSDPFVGSGTTLVACLRMGRRGVGIEISEEYCEIAANRLRKERDRTVLFDRAEAEKRKMQTTFLES
jgi:hypothetical protein